MPTKTSLGPADDGWNRHRNLFHDRREKKIVGWPEKPYPSNPAQKQTEPKQPSPHSPNKKYGEYPPKQF
jgi:hypothetical protein